MTVGMQLTINENRYRLQLEDLIVTAHRLNNSKRNFLFVSKALGKHIEVNPNMCKVMGFLLASLRYGRSPQLGYWIDYVQKPSSYRLGISETLKTPYETDEKVVVMGFAETATGLGMAVASAIKDAYYIHTTREPIGTIPNFIQFEEEHSHATQHRCFPLEQTLIQSADRLIMVDDELTTGKSLLNMIEELIKVTPIRKFTMLSILDWRTPAHEEMVKEMCEKHGIEIEIQALIKGVATSMDQTIYQGQTPLPINECIEQANLMKMNEMPRFKTEGFDTFGYYRHNGRFGVSQSQIEAMEVACEKVAQKINDELEQRGWKGKFYGNVLVLGHGEDIYYPSRVASYLSEMYDGTVAFKSTTRSPIYCKQEAGYPIEQAHVFKDSYGVDYFYYNKDKIDETYDAVVFIGEKELRPRLAKKQITVLL